jgi:hypothetical protein
VNERDEIFNSIVLEVSHSNLYDAWDSFMMEEIDYRNDANEVVRASKEMYISTSSSPLPEQLCFQIQRVIFDKKTSLFYIFSFI